MGIKVFDVSDEGVVGVALPKSRPGRCQLVFVEGGEQRVVEIPATKRMDLAMALLSADGAVAKVNLTWPPVRSSQIRCPECAARPGEKCWSAKPGAGHRSPYHKQRSEAARRATLERQRGR